MKKFFTIFFVTLGVIFFCIILALAYFWIADPYNIKPFINQTPKENIEKLDEVKPAVDSPATSTNLNMPTTADAGSEGGLTEGQKNALQLVGIDPAVLPERLTPEQEQCFVGEFGQTRVNEIKAGAAPTPLEVLTGKHCL
jgi:hypothetical protein